MATSSRETPKHSYGHYTFPDSLKWLKEYLEKATEQFDRLYKENSVNEDTIRRYKLIRTLGAGSFGRVMLSHLDNDPKQRPFAIKILLKEKIIKMKQVEHTLSEKRILLALKSPFIVNCLAAFKDTTNLYIVLEFVNGGELFHLLRRKGKFPESWCSFYSAQITLGLQYIHACGLVYRDLKPENILVDNNGYLKMTDFGFAKHVGAGGHTWTLCGTPQYLAPEMVLNRSYGKSVDYWGLGILIYELNAGVVPFDHKVPLKLYELIVECRLTFPSHFKPDLQDLLKNIITTDVTKRYGNLKNGALDIITHDWFKNTDFKKIQERTEKAPWIPNLKGPLDCSNFEKFPEESISISKTMKYEDEFEKF